MKDKESFLLKRFQGRALEGKKQGAVSNGNLSASYCAGDVHTSSCKKHSLINGSRKEDSILAVIEAE